MKTSYPIQTSKEYQDLIKYLQKIPHQLQASSHSYDIENLIHEAIYQALKSWDESCPFNAYCGFILRRKIITEIDKYVRRNQEEVKYKISVPNFTLDKELSSFSFVDNEEKSIPYHDDLFRSWVTDRGNISQLSRRYNTSTSNARKIIHKRMNRLRVKERDGV